MGTGILNAGLIGKALDRLAAGDTAGADGMARTEQRVALRPVSTRFQLMVGGAEVRPTKARTVHVGVFSSDVSTQRRRPAADRRGTGTRKGFFVRYRETGEVHIDFHRSTNGTIAYLRTNYGRAFLDETFRRMAHDVYRQFATT